jgi:hypothetical protein
MVQRRRVLPPPIPGSASVSRVCLAAGGSRLAFLCPEGDSAGIYVGDSLDPSSARRIVDNVELGVEDLAWGPDGEHLAYRLSPPLGGRPWVGWASAAAGELGRVEGSAFAWTPRGKALIVADPGRKMISRIAVPSGKGIDLSPFEDDMDPGFPPQIAISSDGRRIAFTVGRDGEDVSEVWVIERKGTDVSATLFTEVPGASVHIFPFWSKKAVTLALYMVHYEQQKSAIIAVRKLEGEGVVLYESGCLDPPVSPVWSPSGQSILFFRADERALGEDESGPPRLVLLDSRRESFVALTEPNEMRGKLSFLDDRTLAVDGGAAAHVLSFAEPP